MERWIFLLFAAGQQRLSQRGPLLFVVEQAGRFPLCWPLRRIMTALLGGDFLLTDQGGPNHRNGVQAIIALCVQQQVDQGLGEHGIAVADLLTFPARLGLSRNSAARVVPDTIRSAALLGCSVGGHPAGIRAILACPVPAGELLNYVCAVWPLALHDGLLSSRMPRRCHRYAGAAPTLSPLAVDSNSDNTRQRGASEAALLAGSGAASTSCRCPLAAPRFQGSAAPRRPP